MDVHQKTLGPQDFGFRPDNANDEVTEYDSSSDEVETETDVSKLDRGPMFLFGTTTRFGCQVQIHSRLNFMTGISFIIIIIIII